MCGLAGYIGTGKNFLYEDIILQKMHESIRHRGPDGHGVWVSQEHRVALVHRRLSILDLSDVGLQPMFDRERSVGIAFNGEIYNYTLLREELKTYGYEFKTNTDTEVFLYAFKQWGIACLDRLEGMFAAVLGDLIRNEWYLVRDRIGIKPLYFSVQGDYISFASEIKALWHLPWMHEKYNELGIYHYLTYMVTPAPFTVFDGVYKLPASFYMKIRFDRSYSFHRWYDPVVKKSIYTKDQCADEKFCVEEIRRLMRTSIQKRMQSDVPFGVFLSGGVDSSMNVALMSEYTDRVRTFNVAFSDGPEYSEVMWARKVAKQFGTEHHEITLSEKEAFEFFTQMIYHQDEPIADCVCIPLYYVAKLLKDHGVTVVQVGEGSDELFCGYQNYAHYLDLYRAYWRPAMMIPFNIRRSAAWVAARVFPNKQHHLSLLHRWAAGQHLFWSGAQAFSDELKQKLWKSCDKAVYDPMIQKIFPDFSQDYTSYAIVEYHLQQLHKLDLRADFLKSMIYLELKQRLSELLLMRVDKMTMATSVEARVPFLDHKIVEFALQIPTELKYRNGVTKYILKKACEGILSKDLIYRKKMGFAAPITRWFRSGKYFKPYFKDIVLSNKKKLPQFFNKEFIVRLLHETEQNKNDYSVLLWVTQNLCALKEIV